jgi:hypothetical protein
MTPLPQACCPKTGEELTISYGDKGNEELLLLYGFAQPANPYETLMLLCPLPPPDEWDDVFTARMQLLQVRATQHKVCPLSPAVDTCWIRCI